MCLATTERERERDQTHFHTKTFEIQNKLFEIQKKLGTMMPWMTLVANKGGQT